MNVKTYIRNALAGSQRWAMSLLRDMQDQPLAQPTSNGGNHPLWVLGHLVYSESFLLDECLLGKPNRYPQWQELFTPGSQPLLDQGQYPSMPELFGKWEEVRSAVLAHLDSLSDADFDRPSAIGNKYGDTFSTVGGCYSALTSHPVYHAGQVADARRAAGKPPLFM